MTAQNREPIKKRQQYLLLGALALLGIALLALGSTDDTAQSTRQSAEPASTSATATAEYNDAVTRMEQKLAYTLSQIQDAGTVTVQISVKHNGRKEYAVDTQRTSRTTVEESGDTSQQTTELQEQISVVQQNQNGAQQALLVAETAPEINGVLIVASGAGNATVQERLLHAAAAVLQVPLHQIIVVPGEEG